MLTSSIRDGAEWVWISRGDTCPYCQMLASRGWVKASKKVLKGNHASHIHAHCDCEFAIRFDGKSTVEGYNPQRFKRIYDNADGKSFRDKINSIRRENYDVIKEERNERRREIYKRERTSYLQSQLPFEFNGERNFIPKNAEINYVKAIAGRGTNKNLNQAKKLSDIFGDVSEDWTKKVGQIKSDRYLFDVHWYEDKTETQYRAKVKIVKEVHKK